MISYRHLTAAQLMPSLFAHFDRYQEVKQCWRQENNTWILKDIAFIDDWEPKHIDILVKCLSNTVRTGGAVIGAFEENQLVGFAALENELFGRNRRYLQLSSLHVTYPKRGGGIGRELFRRIGGEAERRGADKLYISAHSARETQAFYRAMGCKEAEEYNSRLAAAEPCDCQLEFQLKPSDR